MSKKLDASRVGNLIVDRRVKLLPCQKEMVGYWYKQGLAIRAIARMFKVDKRLIQFILFPERQKKNLSDRADRGGSKAYYNREKHTKAMREHRQHKRELSSFCD